MKGLKMDMNRYETQGMLTETSETRQPQYLTNAQLARAAKFGMDTGEPIVCWWDQDDCKVRFWRLSDYDGDEGQAFIDERDVIAII